MAPSNTPGCFAGLFRRNQATIPQQEATAPVAAEQPEKPPRAPDYMVAEPCMCHHDRDFADRLAKKIVMDDLPAYGDVRSSFRADVKKTILEEVESLTEELMEIQIYLSDHPEVNYMEKKAHDKLTSYLDSKGFDVEKHFKLPTAWRATFEQGKGGRTFGFNSEMDALPGIGHACGHNLIAVCGVAAFMGVAKALKTHGIDGKVILLGTPAEEGGGGKVALLEKGGYEGIEACMMNHPGFNQAGAGLVAPTLAIQTIWVEYFGKTSHAASAPWDGVNALDAAVAAYNAISTMRQQIKSTDRVHGIITDGGQAPNIIPEHTKLKFFVRARDVDALEELKKKIIPCFEAAAKSSGCEYKLWTEYMQNDLRNTKPLAEEYAAAMKDVFDYPVSVHFELDFGGSTDFGNVTYSMPACHPMFGIDHDPLRANHTPEFTARARTPGAHKEAMKAAVGMACVGMRFLEDDEFADATTSWWKDDMGK